MNSAFFSFYLYYQSFYNLPCVNESITSIITFILVQTTTYVRWSGHVLRTGGLYVLYSDGRTTTLQQEVCCMMAKQICYYQSWNVKLSHISNRKPVLCHHQSMWWAKTQREQRGVVSGSLVNKAKNRVIILLLMLRSHAAVTSIYCTRTS